MIREKSTFHYNYIDIRMLKFNNVVMCISYRFTIIKVKWQYPDQKKTLSRLSNPSPNSSSKLLLNGSLLLVLYSVNISSSMLSC